MHTSETLRTRSQVEMSSAMKRLSLSAILCLFGLLCLTAGAVAQIDNGRLALKGYDPVAYFTEERAAVGDSQFQHEWDGAIYHFVSQKHRELFKLEPERYLPQYDNWCAASVAKGLKVLPNPEYWVVVDGRLYLFGKPIGPDLMRNDPVAMKERADKNWPTVSHLPAPPQQ
jgi:YHS domain-containing protein